MSGTNDGHAGDDVRKHKSRTFCKQVGDCEAAVREHVC
jgi:hypothetical protein